jgi:hypothetical protein
MSDAPKPEAFTIPEWGSPGMEPPPAAFRQLMGAVCIGLAKMVFQEGDTRPPSDAMIFERVDGVRFAIISPAPIREWALIHLHDESEEGTVHAPGCGCDKGEEQHKGKGN